MNSKEINFTLSLVNLKNIPFDKYEKDFTFIVNGKRYSTPRIVADILSPKIREFHLFDESIDEFQITSNNKSDVDYFSDFLNLCQFQTVKLDTSRRLEYLLYFKELGNIEGYFSLHPEFFSELTRENAISRLIFIIELLRGDSTKYEFKFENSGKQLSETISFISSHFYEMNNDELKKIPIEILYEIISSQSLKIKNEDSLFEFVMNLYKEDRIYSELFSQIIFSNLSEESIEKFISLFSIDDLTTEIWYSICNLLSKKSNNASQKNNRYLKPLYNYIEFKYVKGHEFEGIMHHLCAETNGNIHDNGTIKINSNSISGNNHPKNLVDYKSSNYYYSENQTDIFVCFDFKDKRIQLDRYSIKSYESHKYSEHLRNWVIEVSNDETNWEEIDRHSDESTLNESGLAATFEVKKKLNDFYRFIRLRQTGVSWYDDKYYLVIEMIEFFGKLETNHI